MKSLKKEDWIVEIIEDDKPLSSMLDHYRSIIIDITAPDKSKIRLTQLINIDKSKKDANTIDFSVIE